MRPLFGLAAICAGAVLTANAMFSYLPTYLNLIGLVACVFFIIKLSGDDFNFRSVAIAVGLALILELVVVSIYSGYLQDKLGNFISNNVHFGTHLLFDFLVLAFISYRRTIMLFFFKSDRRRQAEILKPAIIDAPLYGVFVLFCMLDGLALSENIIRNLDRIGFSVEFSKQFWDWMFFYNNYEILKAILIGLMFMTLFACAYIANKQSKRMEVQGAA